MRHLWIGLLTLTTACEFANRANGTDGGSTSDLECAAGFVEDRSGELFLGDIQWNGISTPFDFDQRYDLDGEPAVCVSENGTAVRFVIGLNGEPVGTVEITATDEGVYELEENPPATLRIAIDDPFDEGFGRVVFTTFTLGTLDVSSVGDVFEFAVASAQSRSSGGQGDIGLLFTANGNARR